MCSPPSLIIIALKGEMGSKGRRTIMQAGQRYVLY
jgi:hypothetical protein